MARYIFSGNEIEYTAGTSADVKAGDIVVIGTTASNIAGIAQYPIAKGTKGKICVEGVVEVDCGSATTFTEGAPVYYSTSTAKATATNTDYLIGKAFSKKVSGELTAKVILNK